ncbi:TPA: hypothetical protein N0F65_009214 [Lagenidium giganteum]|uniref:EF-hand domain-containing protein n=1 Tax=Lagenidium giganteum TaxID=4803 RepID=A0AAV2YTB5_9STRA|nr:TPA: hypothetical protein N0F65_009214 [Lagenidium giganteum]
MHDYEAGSTEDKARFSRVQLVSSRRRPSEEDGAGLSKTVVGSTSATRNSDWMGQHAPKLTRQKSQQERFEEQRPSLPSYSDLSSRKTTLNRGIESIPILADTPRKHSDDPFRDHEMIEDHGNYQVYVNPDSPVLSNGAWVVVQAVDEDSPVALADVIVPCDVICVAQPKRSPARPPSSRPAIVTEVGDTHFLPMFNRNGPGSVQGNQTASNSAANASGHDNVPHMSIEETQKYTFAMILHHTDQVFKILRKRFPSKSNASLRQNLDVEVSRLQQKCVRRLVQAGLGVTLLDNALYDDSTDEEERQASKNICILINPKKEKDLLLHEFKREMDELAIRQGEGLARISEASLDSLKDMCFSPALELQLTHNIIQNALKDYDVDDWTIEMGKQMTVHDVIENCFPLHDRSFNRKFFAEYRKRTFDLNLRKTTAGNSGRWAVEELRLHFGERVAFLFAFMHIYTKHLLPITALCVCYYLCFRCLSGSVWREYMQGLAAIGFGVACFWGPSFLVCWERETRLLTEKWKLDKYKNTVYEKNDENPNFKYRWHKNELTGEMEKVPKARRHYWIQLTMLFYVLLSAIIQCVCLLPFIQWYVYAKNAPRCLKCNTDGTYSCIWFITCFNSKDSTLGTDRWVYILIQGVALGLLIDIIFFEVFNWISEKFVDWENFAKKSDYENRLIHRRFVFVWTNWFFWFLFLAFVYLPFGRQFLDLFKKIGLGKLAPYEWDPALLTLDTLFVTPLVVTQFLNMLLETIVPYLVRKLRGRPVACRKASPFAWCAQRLMRGVQKRGRRNDEQRVKHLTAKRLAGLVNQKTDFNVVVKPVSDDCNAYSAYQIIAESKLPVFDPVLDYLDASIQFSYVIMFTGVWPLLPFPAFFNNILEVRGDAFRLLFAHRRPMPRRDTSIGEWVTVLGYANIIGVTVVMAFIVVYHLGYFQTGCDFTFSDGDMVPFSQVKYSKSTTSNCDNLNERSNWIMIQIVLFVFLEHIGFCLRYLVLQFEKTPYSIRNSGYLRLKQIHELTSTRPANAKQFEYIKHLSELFDKYDTDADGHLREAELIPFLAEWICKHPSELMSYSGIIFRYMDKNKIGRVPFTTCCLMLQHVNHDRFFSCLLGLYDPENGLLNEDILHAEDGLAIHRVMSEVSSVVSERRSSMSRVSFDSTTRPRDSTFFYFNPAIEEMTRQRNDQQHQSPHQKL